MRRLCRFGTFDAFSGRVEDCGITVFSCSERGDGVNSNPYVAHDDHEVPRRIRRIPEVAEDVSGSETSRLL